jgi:flagellar biosynthesis/type III secretory pathway protein FliH
MLEYHQEVKRIEEKHEMARFITTAERVGLIKGRQEGMQQGMQQGVAEVVIRALRRRFGVVAPAVISKIYQTDVDTLLSWEEKIAAAKVMEDIITE